MGLRRRSIRLRILFLILIPLLSLIGLYIFVASITVDDARTEQQAAALKSDTGEPVEAYEGQLGAERRLAMIYLAAPAPQTLAQLQAQEAKTDHSRAVMRAAVTSGAAMGRADAGERHAIRAMLAGASGLPALRSRIAARAMNRQQALDAYGGMLTNCDNVLKAVALREQNASLAAQGLALVEMGESGNSLLAEDALLESAMAARSFSAADRRQFAELVGARRALAAAALPDLNASDRYFYAKDVNPQAAAALESLEDTLVADNHTGGPPPVQPDVWRTGVAQVSTGFSQAGLQAADDLTARARPMARAIYLRLLLAGGLGLLAVLVSVFVSIWIGRSLVRQLAELRRSALTLASERLPRVMARLRAGEDVDVSAEAPPIAPSPDEIGQVGQAFNTVQRTAVEAAVDQAKLQRGISDVFRNLARRSQSLLHRQLALLDTMERRASDPDELGDLYRLDHLTTRMRRHAEGLIILSGAAPGRSWRNPVRLVDVLRAAVAEIEDYTRVKVVTMTQAALAGQAVADVIHMVAELVENATIFSPPNTSVRLSGDVVGKGFAVEIEDRGLGLSGEKIAEINKRLAHPPEFDLSDSDQLGLFVAGRLARRHGIRVSLRPNPYGGTTAIVLIPRELVVPEEVYARDPAATRTSQDAVRPTGRHAARSETIIAAAPAPTPAGTHPYAAGTPAADAPPGSRLAEALSGAGLSDAGPGETDPGPGETGPGETGLSEAGLNGGGPSGNGAAGSVAVGSPACGDLPVGPEPGGGTPAGVRPADRQPQAGADGAPAPAAGGDGSSGAYTIGTSPVNWFQRSLDGWPAHDGPAQADPGAETADLTELGLPRRIRQANLAPQLRNTGPHTLMATGDEDSASLSPEEARATMTAIQRGWERGRSAFEADITEPGPGAGAEPDATATEGGNEE